MNTGATSTSNTPTNANARQSRTGKQTPTPISEYPASIGSKGGKTTCGAAVRSSNLLGRGGKNAMSLGRILVACEYSGTVRDAFAKLGWDAWSCDILPTDSQGNHIQCDVMSVINDGWDMMVAFPPCTYLTVTGNKWLKDQPARKSGALVGEARRKARQEGIAFFNALKNAQVPRIAIENPVGCMSSEWREPDQIIQPYYFGDAYQKTTCLWLKNLPLLQHAAEDDWFATRSHVGKGEIYVCKTGNRIPKWYAYADKSQGQAARAKNRSKTPRGLAEAMANQWTRAMREARNLTQNWED